jgi:hypothetical protein
MSDFKETISQWEAGKPLRVLKLGHSADVRQQSVYDHVFQILKRFESEVPTSFVVVDGLVRESEKLSIEEIGAAASFAWSVLRNGWDRAIAGHPDNQYITLKREAEAA